tara:strand:- start:6329 stop:6673 length:345 start_codon:yes stop_codon:yes gene_type:complete
MSKLAEYRALAIELEKLQSRQEALQKDESLKNELEFENKVKALIEEYDLTPAKAIALIDPSSAIASTPPRKQRAVKVYVNPHNGETIETKGGNHKGLKQWKEQYGAETVESWLK